MCSGVFDYTPMLARQSVKVEDLRQHDYGVSFLKKDFMKICVHICLHAGEISPLQQLSAGAWGGFPWKEPQAGHSATHRSKSCNMEI